MKGAELGDVDLEDENWPMRFVLLSTAGLWIPARSGDPNSVFALLMGCFDPWGAIVDIVAWEGHRPNVWWLRTGVAQHLGDHWLNGDRPVRVVETPAEYLRDRGECVVILDWTADLRAIFEDGPELVCRTARLWRRIEQAVAIRPARLKIWAAA